MKSIDDAIQTLQLWADATPTHTFMCMAPSPDTDADTEQRLRAPSPQAGSIPEWKIPPSLARALTHFSYAQISWGEASGHDEFIILDAEGMREYNGVSVHG